MDHKIMDVKQDKRFESSISDFTFLDKSAMTLIFIIAVFGLFADYFMNKQ